MNRSEIIRGLARESDLTQEQVDKLISRFLEVIANSLACDEDVLLSGFGKFESRHRNAVMRVNPKTREPVMVPSKRTVGFVPSPILKKAVSD